MHQYQLSHHIYTDDMQLYAHSTLTDVHSILLQRQICITVLREWFLSRRIQLNDAKTVLVWFGSRYNLTKLASSDYCLLVGGNNIKPSTTLYATYRLGVCGIPQYGSESKFQKPNRTVPNYSSNSDFFGICFAKLII